VSRGKPLPSVPRRPGSSAGSRRSWSRAAPRTAARRPAWAPPSARPAARCAPGTGRPWCRSRARRAGRPAAPGCAAGAATCDQRADGQVVVLAEHLGPGEVGEHRRQQGQAESRAGDQHVLPGGLGGAVGVLDRDQQRRDDRGDLDRDPQQRQAAHHRRGQHRPGEQVEPGVEAPARSRWLVLVEAVVFEVADRVHRHGRVQEARGQQEDLAERVDPQVGQVVEVPVPGGGDQREDEPEARDARDRRDHRGQLRGQRGAGYRRRQRDDQQGEDDGEHRLTPCSLVRSAVDSDSDRE
jgi:hypothetical protein